MFAFFPRCQRPEPSLETRLWRVNSERKDQEGTLSITETDKIYSLCKDHIGKFGTSSGATVSSMTLLFQIFLPQSLDRFTFNTNQATSISSVVRNYDICHIHYIDCWR
jgi:hypothetical protein